MKIKQSYMDVVMANRAIDVLQPRRQGGLVSSPYDIGFNKVTHALTRTYEYTSRLLKPLMDIELKFGFDIQTLEREQLKHKKDSDEWKECEQKRRQMTEDFNASQKSEMDQEVEAIYHQVDLKHWSRKCRTPPFWVLRSLKHMWLNEGAPKEAFRITCGDAKKMQSAVREWLKAVPAHQIDTEKLQEAIARTKDDETRNRLVGELERAQNLVFPEDIGLDLALKLYWNFHSAELALESHRAALTTNLSRLDLWQKEQGPSSTSMGGARSADSTPSPEGEASGEPSEPAQGTEDSSKLDEEPLPPMSQADFDAWIERVDSEILEIPGIAWISYSDIPEGVATPNGIVMDGLMPILKEE